MPDGDKRKARNNSVKGKTESGRGQQLSDKRASMVAKGKLTYEQAMKRDKADDAKKAKSTHISKQGRGGKVKMKPVKGSKLDRHGNMVNY